MLLAVDTSTRTVGLALYDGVQVLSEMTWTSHDHHTVELAPAVAGMLERSNFRPGDVQAIAVALGPGSFTGLRIGLAFAKGLALVRRLALIGIPSLEVLATSQAVIPGAVLAAVLKAGRGRLAVGWFLPGEHGWQATGQIEVLTPADLSQRIQSPTLICGELTEEERRLLGRKRKNALLATPAQGLRRPAFLAELGWQRWQQGTLDDPATLAPIYLHYNEPIPG